MAVEAVGEVAVAAVEVLVEVWAVLAALAAIETGLAAAAVLAAAA